MLKFQASERISAEDALHHSYIRKIDRAEEEDDDEGYPTPDSTPPTLSDTCSHLNISNSSDSGILPDS